DQHRVDVPSGEQFSEIAVHGAILIAVMTVGYALDLFAPGALDIADSHKLHVLLWKHDAQIVLAARAQTDSGEDNPFTRGDCAIAPEHSTGDDEWDGEGGAAEKRMFEKTTAAYV